MHARSLRLDAAVILVGSDSIRSQTNHTFQTDSPFMTTPENQDPWGSLADSLGVPAGSAPEPPVEKKAPEPAPAPVNPAPKAEAPRREPRPAPTADWTALANEFGLEPAAEPAAPAAEPAAAEATPTSQDAPREDRRRSDNRRDNERRGRSPQADRPKRDDHDDLAKKLASGSRLWDDEPTPAAPAAPAAPPVAARPVEERRVAESAREETREPDSDRSFLDRPVRQARVPAAAEHETNEHDAAEGEGEDRIRDRDADAEGEGEDRPRRRRRGRRGGRGRSRSRRDEAGRDEDAGEDADRLSDDLGEQAEDERDTGDDGGDTPREEAEADDRDEPRRGRGRRGRGRRTRRGADADGERRPRRDDEGDELPEPRGSDDEPADAESGETIEAGDEAVGEDGEPRKKRRRRGRRGGRRRSKRTDEDSSGDATSNDGEEESGDEPTPTGYVTAGAKKAKPEGSRRRGDADGEKSGDDRRRRRRRGRGSDEKSGTRGRGRPAFRPVSSSFSQDDEGLEYLGLDDGDDSDAPATPRRSDASTDEAVAESGLDAVREVPSWVEAIGIVIAGNLDARAKAPAKDNGRSSRGRSGRS